MRRVLISRYGGKWYLRDWLLSFEPSFGVLYCEVFGGSGTLLFARERLLREVFNDLDGDVANFFRVLRDRESFLELERRIYATEYGRSVFEEALRILNGRGWRDEVEWAWAFYVVSHQSFNGAGRSWRSVRQMEGRRTLTILSSWYRKSEDLFWYSQRLRRVIIESLDFEECIRRYDDPTTFFYCDPPYVLDTRVADDVYKHEMSLADHERLVRLLLEVKGRVLLSGYRHEVYRPLEEAGWHIAEKEFICWSGYRRDNARARRVETVWMNYDPISFERIASNYQSSMLIKPIGQLSLFTV